MYMHLVTETRNMQTLYIYIHVATLISATGTASETTAKELLFIYWNATNRSDTVQNAPVQLSKNCLSSL